MSWSELAESEGMGGKEWIRTVQVSLFSDNEFPQGDKRDLGAGSPGQERVGWAKG